MPTITPQQRSSVTQSDDSWRAPVKEIRAQPTGMNIEKQAPPEKSGQPDPVNKAEEKGIALSPQLSALARKEAKIRQDEQALKAEKAAIESQKAEFERLSKIKDRLSAKDYSVLDELEVKYDDWTNYLLNKGETEKPEYQELKSLKDEVNNLKKSQEDNVTKQFEATKAQYLTEIKELVGKDPEYSAVKEKGAEGHVLQHILDTFNEDNVVLSVEQATKEVEDYLLEDIKKDLSLTKIKAMLQPKEPEKKQLPPPKTGLRTLTNSIAPASDGAKKYPQAQFLSMKERIELATQKAAAKQQQ